MTNEPQDLTLSEKAEYKILSSKVFRAFNYGVSVSFYPGSELWHKSINRMDRYEELKHKKEAYDAYQKTILSNRGH